MRAEGEKESPYASLDDPDVPTQRSGGITVKRHYADVNDPDRPTRRNKGITVYRD